MSKKYRRFYYINGKVFEEKSSKRALIYARHYTKEQGFGENDIFELSSDSELEYLKLLLDKKEKGEIQNIQANHKITIIEPFKNYQGEEIPAYEIECSFAYQDLITLKTHYIKVVDSVYELNKSLIKDKIVFDYLLQNWKCLEIYYLDKEGKWKVWNIYDKEIFVKESQALHKKKINQMRAIRDREKYDRLLLLRKEGKITNRQRQELYRLEKVFEG